MKHLFFLSIFLMIFKIAGAQQQSKSDLSSADDVSLSNINCITNTFWTVDGSGVSQWILNGGAATFDSIVAPVINLHLAYCNNVDSISLPATFYSIQSIGPSLYSPVYFNGTNWDTSSATVNVNLLNPGGYGDYLYFMEDGINWAGKSIYRHVGDSLYKIYTLPQSKYITVADMAVDDNGNCYFFSGSVQLMTDSLNVISPTGQLIAQLALPLNTIGAYGCIMLNGTLYIAFTNASSLYPQVLLPLIINGQTITPGTPIFLPSYFDMASCQPGVPLALPETQQEFAFGVFPNPVIDFCTVKINASIANRNSIIKVFDVEGRILKSALFQSEMLLDFKELASGIYFIHISEPESSVNFQVKKVVKR